MKCGWCKYRTEKQLSLLHKLVYIRQQALCATLEEKLMLVVTPYCVKDVNPIFFLRQVPLFPEQYGNLPQEDHEAVQEMLKVTSIFILPSYAIISFYDTSN